jgi:hypothetical protein
MKYKWKIEWTWSPDPTSSLISSLTTLDAIISCHISYPEGLFPLFGRVLSVEFKVSHETQLG